MVQTSTYLSDVFSNKIIPFFQKNITNPEYETLFTNNDATHVVNEVTIGDRFDIIVEYELSDQENRKEIEEHIIEALNFGCTIMDTNNTKLSHNSDKIPIEKLRISVGQSLKMKVSLTNVSFIL